MKERFKDLRKALKLTQTEIGKAIGKGLRAVQHYEAGERKIDESTVLLLQQVFNVNPGWIKTGFGDMFDSPQKVTCNVATKPALITPSVGNVEDISIKYFPEVSASAGAGSFIENERFMTLRMDRRVCKPTKTSIIIDVVGESMEPTLINKDKIIIDTAIDPTMLKKGKIYAISYEDKLLIKRFVEKLNNRYVFDSDNKAYMGIVMTPNDKDRIIGELKYLIYREMK